MLRDMMITRGIDDEAARLQNQGAVDLWLSCKGQEAAQVASAWAIGKHTTVFPSYREHGVAVVRGISARSLVAQWAGRTYCGWNPRQYRFFPYTLVLAAQTLHAVGYSLGQRIQGHEDLVVVYIGDGATSEGDMSEAMNLAAVESAAVLFICQNNGWAISKPAHEQMRTEIAKRAEGFGVRALSVHGQNPDEVHRHTAVACDYVRTTRAPYLLELKTIRVRGHSTADDHVIYRDPIELATAADVDPVRDYQQRLEDVGLIDDQWFERVQRDIAMIRQDLVKGFAP